MEHPGHIYLTGTENEYRLGRDNICSLSKSSTTPTERSRVSPIGHMVMACAALS